MKTARQMRQEGDWHSVLIRRFQLLQYVDDDYGAGYTSPTLGIDTSQYTAETSSSDYNSWVIDSSPTSVSENPSLSNIPSSSLSMTGGAAMNTVAANPNVYNLGNQGTLQDISSTLGTLSQFGSGIASLIQGQQAPPIGSTAVRSYPVTPKPTSGAISSSSLLLLLGVGVVLLLFITKKE